LNVKTVVAVERSMSAEDHMTRLESDVGELKANVKKIESDVGELKAGVKTLNARVGEWILASAKESVNLRTEMERGFGAVRAEIEKNRADTEKGFGALETSIESAKLWMLVTGVGSVILVTFVTFLGRALKLF